MVNKSLGSEVLLYFDIDGVPIALNGQTSTNLTRVCDTLDITGRDDVGYSNSIPTIIKWELSCDGFVILDDRVLSYVENYFEQGKPLNVSINIKREDSGKSYNKKYYGLGLIYGIDNDCSIDNALTYSIKIVGVTQLLHEITTSGELTPSQKLQLRHLMELYTCCQGEKHDTLQDRFYHDFREGAYRAEQDTN